MGVKKLTSKEILEKVEELFGDNISAFAYCDYSDAEIPEGFKYDEEKASQIGKQKDDYWNSIKNNLPETYSERKNNPDVIRYQKMPSKWDEMNRQLLEYVGLGKIVEIDQYGGEDQGSTWYSIKHFVDHDVYIRTDGYYQSYNGTEFYQGFGREVKPKQKTVTVYE